MSHQTRSKLSVEVTTGGATFSESTTQHKLVCSAGKRFLVVAFGVDNDVSSTVTVRHMDVSDVMVDIVMSEAATTSHVSYPRNSTGRVSAIELNPGDYMQFDFSVAQTGAAFIIIKYFEVSL